jgi:hypothetical protein
MTDFYCSMVLVIRISVVGCQFVSQGLAGC